MTGVLPKTRAKWHGPLPEIGDFLRSPKRPRFAYRIVGITNQVAAAEDVTYATFTLDRVPHDQVPPEATIHAWRWDPRRRKRGPS